MTSTPMKTVLEEAQKKSVIKDIKARRRLEKVIDDPKIVPKLKLKLLNKPGQVEGKPKIKSSIT